MQQPQRSTLPAVPENRQKINLSPFTWNHLTLPPLSKAYNSIDLKPKMEKEKGRLTTISEAKPRNKDGVVSLKKRLSKQQKSNSKEKHTNKTLIAQSTQQMQRPHKKNKTKTKNIINQVNKTIGFVSSIPNSQKLKLINEKNNTDRYMKTSLIRNGWRNNKKPQSKETQLMQRFFDQNIYHDQIQGSVNLQDYLYEQMKVHGRQFYPLSFLIPKDYEAFMLQNNKIAVQSMLRQISLQILQYFQTQNMKDNTWSETKVHIGDILQSSIVKTSNQHVSTMIKMCMYLQNIRIQEKYNNYFQQFPGYFKINIRPKPHFFDILLKQAVHYLDKSQDLFLKINYRNIDVRLLVLILHYDQLFKQNEPTYDSPHQLWIVKSVASSKETDIIIVKSSSQFCSVEEYSIAQYKNRKKYQNKIIQKYIANPYLLSNPPSFSNCKFEIRQWVLVVSRRTSFTIYKYNTAYCRFARLKYDSNKFSKDIHLTNHDHYKNETQEDAIMMIQQLFEVCRQDLRGKYAQQSAEIIKNVILNSKSLKCQQGCYQLFGFDFLVDNSGKLYLLKITLNPEKSIPKSKKLKQQSQVMVKTMTELVISKKSTEKWVRLSGPELEKQDSQFLSFSEIQVKPFYRCSLEQGQSLIALIRQRRRLFTKLTAIIKVYLLRHFFKRLKGQEENISLHNAKNQTNRMQSRGEIRFIEERQHQNI